MSIQNQINEELKSAMKSKDMLKMTTLRMLKAQMKDFEIAQMRPLTEEDEMSVLANAAKKRKEAIALYEKSQRNDLLEKEKEELDIINAYLPEQLSKEEVAEIISRIIEDTGASTLKDIGKVMSSAMQQLKGKTDGKIVQEIVRSRLSH